MNSRSMSFESPDVEKDFPGLYASERMREFRREMGEDGTKKREGGKKKEFKKKDKDKGYRMFEQEDSDEERLVSMEDSKNPLSKMKKHSKPSFKFAKKEKLYKVKEKSEKEEKKEEGKKEKEEKGEKKKEKLKFRKKKKMKPEENVEAAPIFGVPISTAVERNKCHDGIPLPAMVRECVDYIEEFGLGCEGIYRISGVKSKVQALKEAYNRGQPVYLPEYEPNVIASLLKLFLRELPEPVLTTEYMPKFEQASTIKNVKQKVESFQNLIQMLPPPNRLLLSWMIVHMTHVITREKQNKMSLQNVSIVLSPTMQISHRVLNVLFTYSKILFRDVTISKYVPPLKPVTSRWSLELPESPSAIEEELRKQESLLNQLHQEIAQKHNEEKEERLWEVQRVCTQLKRKLKLARKAYEAHQQSEKRDREMSETKSAHILRATKEKAPGIPTGSRKSQGSPPKQISKEVQSKEDANKEVKKSSLKVKGTTPTTPRSGGIVGVPDLGASASPTQHKPLLEQQLQAAERRKAAEKIRAAEAEKKTSTESVKMESKEVTKPEVKTEEGEVEEKQEKKTEAVKEIIDEQKESKVEKDQDAKAPEEKAAPKAEPENESDTDVVEKDKAAEVPKEEEKIDLKKDETVKKDETEESVSITVKAEETNKPLSSEEDVIEQQFEEDINKVEVEIVSETEEIVKGQVDKSETVKTSENTENTEIKTDILSKKVINTTELNETSQIHDTSKIQLDESENNKTSVYQPVKLETEDSSEECKSKMEEIPNEQYDKLDGGKTGVESGKVYQTDEEQLDVTRSEIVENGNDHLKKTQVDQFSAGEIGTAKSQSYEKLKDETELDETITEHKKIKTDEQLNNAVKKVSEDECVTPTRSTPEPERRRSAASKERSSVSSASTAESEDRLPAERPTQLSHSPAAQVRATKLVKLQSPLQPQKIYRKSTGETDSDSDVDTPKGDTEMLPTETQAGAEKQFRRTSSEDGISMEAPPEFDASREVWEAFGEAQTETPEGTYYGSDEITDVEYDQLQQEHQTLMLEEEELISLRDELRKKIESERSEIERLHQETADLQAIREDLYDSDTSASSSDDQSSDDETELQDILQKLMEQNSKLEEENTDLCQKIHEERQICLDVKVKIRVIQQRRNEPPPDISLIEL